MNENPKPSFLNRRLMMARASLAAAAAAVAPALFTKSAAAFHAVPGERSARYKESEHVKQYYKIIGR